VEATRGIVWSRRTLLVAGWALIAVVVGLRLNEGWMPHDDGSFAQSAQRVLNGELPHRDFAELYTGGMTFLNAGVFRVFGEDLFWLRIPAYLLFLASLPCFYYIARRFAPPAVAGLATVVGYSWGFPVYPAAVPSWYVLFFSIMGVAALLRFLDTQNDRWVVVAGLFGGLAIAFKITGVYYVLGAMLFLLFLDQLQNRGERRRFRLSDLFACAIVPFALIVAASVLRKRFGVSEVVTLLLPLVAVSWVVLATERTVAALPATTRLKRRAGQLGPFCLGVLVPVGLVSLPFVLTGSTGAFLNGVFVTPQTRTDFTYLSLPDPARLLYAIPIVVVLVLPLVVRRTWAYAAGISAAALVAAFVGLAYDTIWAYRAAFEAGRQVAPLVVAIGTISILALPVSTRRRMLAAPLFLTLCMVAYLGLVQYPFGAPVYYCYVAPLVVLAAVGVASYLDVEPRAAGIALLAAFAILGITIMDRGPLSTLGLYPTHAGGTAILDPRRASIRIPADERATYTRVVELLREHDSGPYTFAGPDAPEVYFLSDRENPTRALFDFLDDTDSARGAKLVDTLVSHHVTAIAINFDPGFSSPLDAGTLRSLRAIYPQHEPVGRFDVRWKAD
jgi:hypothetical protein